MNQNCLIIRERKIEMERVRERERRRKRGIKGKNCVSNKEVFISIQNCCCRDKQNSRLDIKSEGFSQSVT